MRMCVTLLYMYIRVSLRKTLFLFDLLLLIFDCCLQTKDGYAHIWEMLLLWHWHTKRKSVDMRYEFCLFNDLWTEDCLAPEAIRWKSFIFSQIYLVEGGVDGWVKSDWPSSAAVQWSVTWHFRKSSFGLYVDRRDFIGPVSICSQSAGHTQNVAYCIVASMCVISTSLISSTVCRSHTPVSYHLAIRISDRIYWEG